MANTFAPLLMLVAADLNVPSTLYILKLPLSFTLNMS